MAVSTQELKARIKVEDKASKEIGNVRKELSKLKKEYKELNKQYKSLQRQLKKTNTVKVSTHKANSELKKLENNSRRISRELNKSKVFKIKDKSSSTLDKIKRKFSELKKGGKIPVSIKNMASSGLDAIKGKFSGFGKLGKIALKIAGKHPALAALAVVGLGIAKLAKSAYNDIKVRLNDMTQWTLNKIKQGLAALKDKVINVTIKGYDKYSDYKSRTKFIDKTMDFKEYDRLAFRVARNTRANITEVRDQMTKLIQMSPNVFGKNTEEAAKFYTAAIQSFRKGGSSNEEASAAMYQLNQGLASNTLQGDELHTIRESAPLMAKMIEKEVGVGIKEAGAKGLLTAEVVKNAILKHADEINREFEHIPMNFKDAWVIGGNLIQQKVLTPMYERMQAFLSSDKVASFFNGIYEKASSFFDGIWKLLDMTNFGGIDFSILEKSFAPLGDFINEIYENIVSGSPEAQEAINTLGQVVNGAFEGMGDVFQVFKEIASDVFKFLKTHPDFIKDAIKLLASDWKKNWNEMQTKLQFANDVIIPLLTGLNDLISTITGAIKSLGNWWSDTMKKMSDTNFSGLNALNGFQGTQGQPVSYAMGQERIPYDNFPARLHEGERVLTKREANDYDKGRGVGNGGVVINMYGTTIREEADVDLFTERLVKKMRLELEGGA